MAPFSSILISTALLFTRLKTCDQLSSPSKTFFEGHPRNDLCVWKYSNKKLSKNFLGKSGEIRAKIFRTPKNLPAPIPMVPVHNIQCAVSKFMPRIDQLVEGKQKQKSD